MRVAVNIKRGIEIGNKGLELKVRNGDNETLGRLVVGNKHLSWLPKGYKNYPLKKITWKELIEEFTEN